MGSFLNVVIYRLPNNLSVNEPKRSFCPKCKYQIPFHLNIPIVSWLLLRGKCANCACHIPIRYFLIEVFTAFVFLALVLWKCVPDQLALLLPLAIFFSLLIAATFIDIDHFIIPDEISWGGTIAGVVCSYLVPELFGFPSAPGFAHWLPVLPGLVLAGVCLRLAWKAGGPLREMRDPKRFGLWATAAAASAAGLAMWLKVPSSFWALISSLFGAICGYFLIWGVIELGKWAFGRKKMEFPTAPPFTWVRKGDDADLTVEGDEPSLWSEFFSRPTDRLIMTCPKIAVDGQAYEAVTAVFYWDRVIIQERTWQLDTVDNITGIVTEAIIPREAMGWGDAKLMACIGAFLGWKGVIFAMTMGSLFGSILGVIAMIIRQREWSRKIPFGPYLAAGAATYVFLGPAILDWYFQWLNLMVSPE